jgi:Ran GTPase-activating protein (RanGAP) involved in mRNA processing and transport
MNDKEVKETIKKIKDKKTPLIKLDLSNKSFSEKTAISLFKSLEKKRTLTELNLSRAAFPINTLAFLPRDTCLKKLSLTHCVLLDAGGIELSTILSENTSLIVLNLSDTHIGLKGITVLAEALKKNQVLQELDLSNFDRGEDSENITSIVWILVEMLNVNKKLSLFALRFNHLQSGHKETLEKVIKARGAPLVLNLEGNDLEKIADEVPSVQLGREDVSEEKPKENIGKLLTSNSGFFSSGESTPTSSNTQSTASTSSSPKTVSQLPKSPRR